MPSKLLLSGVIALGILSLPVTAQANSYTEALINTSHPIQPADYTPLHLEVPQVLLGHTPDSEMELDAPAAHALTSMFTAAHDDGLDMVLTSGYRSYDEQAQLYRKQQANMAGIQDAVAPPGTSEHQAGLAADIGTYHYFCAAQDCFAMTKDAAWLQANAYHFGFIQRYPLGKETLTGYEYEPWHYRYVGTTLATYLFNSHLTLEEYYAQQQACISRA